MSLTIEVSENKIKKVKIDIYLDTRESLTKPQWNFERLRNGDNRLKGKGYSDCQFVKRRLHWHLKFIIHRHFNSDWEYVRVRLFEWVFGWFESVWKQKQSHRLDGNQLPLGLLIAEVDWSLNFYWVIDIKCCYRVAYGGNQNNSFNYKRPNRRSSIYVNQKYPKPIRPSRWGRARKNIIRLWNMDFPRCLHAQLQIDFNFSFSFSLNSSFSFNLALTLGSPAVSWLLIKMLSMFRLGFSFVAFSCSIKKKRPATPLLAMSVLYTRHALKCLYI